MLLLLGESTCARTMQPPTPLRPVRRPRRRRAAHPRGVTSGADRTTLTSDHGETRTISLSISAARHDSAANGIANSEWSPWLLLSDLTNARRLPPPRQRHPLSPRLSGDWF